MSGGYRQQPGGAGKTTRKDGKRVAGKQAFPPPGSGGSKPEMAPRDLDYIPEMSVGKKHNQLVLTSMTVPALEPLLESQQLWLTQMQR